MDENKMHYRLSIHHDGERVDRAIAFFSGLSRSKVSDLISRKVIFRNGIPVKKGSELARAGDEIVMPNPLSEVTQEIEPDPTIEYEVVYEDKSFIIINKPSGLVVHPGSGVPSGTLVNGLAARFPDLKTIGDPSRLGLVHRLDKGTSGLLIVARTEKALANLKSQMKTRKIRRQYFAIVADHIESDKGVVDAPLGRDPRNPLKRAVIQSGKYARTHYEVEKRASAPFKVSMLVCQLETGRTHQIRVHLSAIGHPVLGDELYGRRSEFNIENRLSLHAQMITFSHPETDTEVVMESPLPMNLMELKGSFS
jgi:23S rRNA pseudouridine1911/1915/1917 synthase|tara:strand:- start:111536 stop:112462 length:927 start_codon:yes stop_codon:yes gene_type:complete